MSPDRAPRPNEATRGADDLAHAASPDPRVAASASDAVWQTARGPLLLDRPRIVGILNVTPDSFFDGGVHLPFDAAVLRGEALIAEGADVIDVGGESTRPGATSVSAADEMHRVVPVIAELVRRWPGQLISVDTVKSEVAQAALDAGAAAVNDVSALRLDPRIAQVAARSGAGLVLMHSRGTVERMARYEEAEYGADPVGEMIAELRTALERARAGGNHAGAIVLDPGLGFSKRTEHSLAVLARLDRFRALGPPLLVGPSRKRFIGEAAGGLPPEQRLDGTIAACVIALGAGARLFRVHDVAAVRRALLLAEAVRTSV
jgi:dihydropteroate synthase